MAQKSVYRRLCAMLLALSILFTAIPAVLAEEYSESYLSLYYGDATMAEGKSSKDPGRFFANISAISMMDIQDDAFFTQLSTAVDSGYKYKAFVLHDKDLPPTDLAMLYCFEDSSWLLKDFTSARQTVYADVSWEILQGLNLKLQQQDLINQTVPGADGFYECDPEYVWQIFMEFVLFIEERNKAIQQMLAGTTDQIPPLPEEIDGWPLDLPVSVQLPKEIKVLDAYFAVQPAASADDYVGDVPDSQKFEGSVDDDNLVTGTLRFWEAGPHLVRLVFTASLNGQKQSLVHAISIDTGNVRIPEADTCPLFEDGHHWQFAWQEEHPHLRYFACECGEVMDDPGGITGNMPDCCECGNHDWELSFYVSLEGGMVLGRCRRCGIYKEVTDSMPEYITSYLKLRAEIGVEGNAYYEEHNTDNTSYFRSEPAWTYIAGQAINRYTNFGTDLKESFMNTLAEPIVSIIETADGEFDEKINIESKAQLKWIELIQEMIKSYEQDVSVKGAKQVVDTLDVVFDIKGIWDDVKENYLDDETVLKIEKSGSGISNAGKEALDWVPHILNVISAGLEGYEAGEKAEEARTTYIAMLNDYGRSCEILDALRKDAEGRSNEDLVRAVDSIRNILDATFKRNIGQCITSTTKLVNSLGIEQYSVSDATAITFMWSTAKKESQAVILASLGELTGGINPIGIASTVAKIVKGITNYDEIFDASYELAALSSMRSDAVISLGRFSDQVSPYTTALYATLESEGCEKAADFVSTLSSDEDVDKIMRKMIEIASIMYNPTITATLMVSDNMDVDVKEFGIGNNEKETVVNLLHKEGNSYADYSRQCLTEQ